MMLAGALWVGGAILSMVAVGFVSCCGTTSQQQQQVVTGDDDEPKRVCPDCGLENPREADHCGDCGFSFGSSDSSEQ